MEEPLIKVWLWKGATQTWIKDSNLFKGGYILRHLDKKKAKAIWVPESSTNEEIDLMIKILGYE